MKLDIYKLFQFLKKYCYIFNPLSTLTNIVCSNIEPFRFEISLLKMVQPQGYFII